MAQAAPLPQSLAFLVRRRLRPFPGSSTSRHKYQCVEYFPLSGQNPTRLRTVAPICCLATSCPSPAAGTCPIPAVSAWRRHLGVCRIIVLPQPQFCGSELVQNPMRGAVDEAGPDGHQQDQRKLGRLRAGVVLRANIQGWPAVDVATVSVAAGPEGWASFLEAAAGDELVAALAALTKAEGHLP
jgi:hypothetical protein